MERLTISLESELAESVREAAGVDSTNVSVWLAEAARRQLDARGLAGVVAEWEAQHGRSPMKNWLWPAVASTNDRAGSRCWGAHRARPKRPRHLGNAPGRSRGRPQRRRPGWRDRSSMARWDATGVVWSVRFDTAMKSHLMEQLPGLRDCSAVKPTQLMSLMPQSCYLRLDGHGTPT